MELVWDEESISHIWKQHLVKTSEVEQALSGKTVEIQAHSRRRLFLGFTEAGRPLAIVLAVWDEHRHYVVTARPMSEKELAYYGEVAK